MNHEDLKSSLGSYLLGALAPGERREVDAHLTACPRCREELSSYAALPGLLGRLDLEEVAGTTLLPPPSLLPTILAAVEREREVGRRKLLHWRAAAAGLVAAAAVTGILAVTGRPDSAPDRPLVAAAGVVSSGTVSLRSRPWGTELRLRLHDLPAAAGYTAYAVDSRGRRISVARWGPTPQRAADVPGAVPLPPAALASLVVETDSGVSILSLQT